MPFTLRDHRLVLGRRLPVPQRLAGRLDERVDQLDRRLLLLVAEHDGAEHHFLGQLVGLRLDHQHGGFGARDDEVERRGRELGLGRIEHVLAVDVADARGADRPVERDAGQHERRGRADHRRNVGIDFRIDRHHGRDDLHFVVEASGKSGRIGRSMRREVSVSFSDGRPSRLKKPPGILPAANVFSW